MRDNEPDIDLSDNMEEGEDIDEIHDESNNNTDGTNNVSGPTPTDKQNDGSNAFEKKKRAKTSSVWLEFKEVELPDKFRKGECIHCKRRLNIPKSKSTTQFKRHLEACSRRNMYQKQQKKINFMAADSSVGVKATGFVSALHDGKLDMMKMRESAAHWMLMHEHSFFILEEEGFNLMMKRGMPEWQKISRQMGRSDCYKVYEIDKKKLHLQKRVLNFVHLPPPRRGIDIADSIIQVFTISVDNTAANDTCTRTLKDTFSRSKKLVCGGKLFHIRYYAHILNIMVQHGLSEIKVVNEDVRESVTYLNESEARLEVFAEIVQQLQLPYRKLMLDCPTCWNSTYDMLVCAIKFKEVFLRYTDQKLGYTCCPEVEDWKKVEKLCEILELFKAAIEIISGTDYPTANLFLNEVYRVKVLLDKKSSFEDTFTRQLIAKLKEKFDKYWGKCNLLMAIAAILDPRCKMRKENELRKESARMSSNRSVASSSAASSAPSALFALSSRFGAAGTHRYV
ncbi:zinc finger BED domain-containing protein RICESLEEPER 1-like [Elaeis guineensis]|uniref:zinc finger BED domain-containing protein RICESLEEPER 1-like n=1 Tax=Elaeis guineensis var. tenera TaxID=51953 RepID=UPI003C6CD5B4